VRMVRMGRVEECRTSKRRCHGSPSIGCGSVRVGRGKTKRKARQREKQRQGDCWQERRRREGRVV
jgi:hypothetical protein